MVKCAFSGKEIPKGTGKMFVRKNGQILWFLNSKCQKNYLSLNRKPVNYKWTKAYVKGEAGVALKKAAKESPLLASQERDSNNKKRGE
jgi:large subunit ribosomal protein L24e